MKDGADPRGSRLGGWKALARYLNRDVRTLQRWERHRRLPVHRVPGGDLGAVFAWTSEIEGWLTASAVEVASDAPAVPAPGLLVLPFDYQAADSNLQFVGDSLADELIGRLATAELSSTRVLSWTTAKTFRHAAARVPQIASDLDVRYLVEGSVKEAGARWRIDIRVVDAKRDAVLFTDRFRCSGREVLLLQSQIAEAVSEHLALHFAGDPFESEWTHEVDPAALLAHFRGVSQWRSGTRSSITRALELFDESQRIDPSYVPAKAVAASVLIRHRNWFGKRDHAAERKARALSAECAREAPRLVSTILLGGQLAAYDYDWKAAEHHLGAAVSTAPAGIEARTRFSNTLSLQRRFDEADAVFEPVHSLDNSTYTLGMDATRLMWSGRHDEAVARFDEAVAREPSSVYASLMRFATAIHVRDAATAQRYRDEMPDEVRKPVQDFVDGTLAAVKGDRSSAAAHRKAMVHDVAHNDGISYFVAMVDALEGNADGAIEYLSQSVAKHEPQAPCASVDPTFYHLHGDARFNALMNRMNLPAY